MRHFAARPCYILDRPAMGQLHSYIWRLSPTQPLLKLPLEILLSIATQLSSSPESVVALSLTCKSLFAALECDVAKLRVKCRGELLALLEKDISDRFFYCPTCCYLHRFSPRWSRWLASHNCFLSSARTVSRPGGLEVVDPCRWREY